ncbi:MAG: iron-sulfur cluster assembly protein IscA [Gammaproteobacteria bacterium]|nr:iron-sulfur cluster assembly protein IscA [Gammaproteobacteria bacterium]
MSITLTDTAAEQIKRNLARRGAGLGLRVGVRRSGCSGWMYVIDYADEVRPEDSVFEDRGVKVVVDGRSLAYLDGTELDYVREGLNEQFKFRNPNVKDACGCGESIAF